MGNKKNHTAQAGKTQNLTTFCELKNVSLLWAQCHWQRSEKHPSYAWSWRSLVVCCQSSRRQAVNEDGSGEDGEMREKSCSLPFLPKLNTTDRLSKKPLTRIKQTGKLFRAARCEACSSTQLEAIKVHVGHCHNCPVKTFVLFSRHTQRRPLQTLGMIILFFFFLTPHSGLRCVLWKLEWCTPRRCRKVRLHGSQLQTPKKNLLKTWTSLPVRWDASSSIDKTTVEISKTIWTDSFCPSFNLLISKKKQQQQQIFKTQY